MAFTPEQIEYLHSTGQMPDWVYYQQNGRSLQENYNEIKRKNSERTRRQIEERREREAETAALEAEIEKKAEEAIEKALEELLKDFGK